MNICLYVYKYEPISEVFYLSMLITHKLRILAVVPRTSKLCQTSQTSVPNIHFFAIPSSIALKS